MRRAVSARPLRAPWVEMKYSRTDRPSRKLDLIGRGMISPWGLATWPLMPAIWRIWSMFPRAPESTIMLMGLSGLALSVASISFWISALASDQISTSLLRRSSSVRMPRLYCVSALSASFSCFSRISAFLAGVLTSSIEIVSPDWAP